LEGSMVEFVQDVAALVSLSAFLITIAMWASAV
jgi:hypothetical protein